MKFINEVTTMTSITEDLVGTPNYITQLSNFLFLFITLNGCSSHKLSLGFKITRFLLLLMRSA